MAEILEPSNNSQAGRTPSNPLAVTTPPRDPRQREQFAETVNRGLMDAFKRRLSPSDLELWHSEDTLPLKIYSRLDKTIIELAQTFGWRIYFSEVVQERMAIWHDTEAGPALIKQLGEAVHLAALAGQGLAKLPGKDPELQALKPQAVNELRRLLKQYRNFFNRRRTKPTDKEVRQWFLNTVGASPDAFPFWSPNIDSLLHYFKRAQKQDETFIQRVSSLTPARLFDEWGADIHNLSPVTFRQLISKLPPSKP